MEYIKRNYNTVIRISIILLIVFMIILYIKVDFFNSIINLILGSFILAFILSPIKSLFQRKFKMNNTAASILVILIFMGIVSVFLFVIVPLMIKEISNCDFSLDSILLYINKFKDSLIKDNSIFNSIYAEIEEKGIVIMSEVSESAINKLLEFTKMLISLAEIPIITYYLLKEKRKVNILAKKLIPFKRRKVLNKISLDCSRLLKSYIVGQFILSFIISILTLIILLVFKVKLPLWLSLLNGIFNIIPYFGPIIGAIPIVIIALSDSLGKGLWIAVFMIIIQQLEGDIISPKITGHITNIHPGVIILLLILGEKIGGIFGMILAVPIGVIIKVVYEDINHYIFNCIK